MAKVLIFVEQREGKNKKSSFELIGWQMIGGYALQPRWADGHSTGLYSFAYLRRLSAASSS